MFNLRRIVTIMLLVASTFSLGAVTQCTLKKELKFLISTTSGPAPLTVDFTQKYVMEEYPNLPCRWTIDGHDIDGLLPDLNKISHTFTTPGAHTVEFVVYSNELKQWVQIPPFNAKKTAIITVDPSTEPNDPEPNIPDTDQVRFVVQHGITWTFDKDVAAGQFANGDWWVVGPVRVTSISPSPDGGNNGSMVNPMWVNSQAYDSQISGYNSSRGARPPISLDPNQSLVSTISHPGGETADIVGALVRTPYLETAAVLTCLDKAPSELCFRPPYFGTNKPLHKVSTWKYNLLPKLAPPENTPNVANYVRYFQRVWLDHFENWMSRRMHPVANMPQYGREIVTTVGDGGALLCLAVPEADKRKVAISMTQLGIDLYGVAKLHKHVWFASGGHNPGRKFPILLAGKLLNNTGMLTLKDYEVQENCTYFGQDMNPPQTLWTGWQNSGHKYATNVMYCFNPTSATWGDAKWHENHHPREWDDPPFPGNTNWPHSKYDPYRRLTSYAWMSQAIAARILGLKVHWGHDAYFAYCDRWAYEDDAPNGAAIIAAYQDYNAAAKAAGGPGVTPVGGSYINEFAKEMYTTYRAKYD